MTNYFVRAGLFAAIVAAISSPVIAVPVESPGARPNVVLLLADDMGYGEVQCLNKQRSKIPTPCMDEIAAAGMVFTDAHSGSSVCTPTRYGLMTGRYAWRTRLQQGVLTGGESLIDKERLTIAKMLRSSGYHTAMFGKWHLGMLFDDKSNSDKGLAIGTKISQGPIERGGFDRFVGFHHSRQMDLWIEDDVVTEHVKEVDVLPRLTIEAVKYIESRKGLDQPFFLYVPWNSPHSPVVPSKEWQGKSGLNAHADFVMQTDDSIGKVMSALEKNGFDENTLVICCSDNGTSAPTSKMSKLKSLGHYSSGVFRGSKTDIWDGGHRVPFIVQWPKVVKPGSTTDQLVCLSDVIATVAEITVANIPDKDLPDSISFLPLLKQEPGRRVDVIHHSIDGSFAFRQEKWKLILCAGSGGWSNPKNEKAVQNGTPKWQLYDMENDVGETNNLIEQEPAKVKELLGLLQSQIENGRSTPGARLANDTTIQLK